MTIEEKVKELVKKVRALKENARQRLDAALPSGCYFLNADEILCRERTFGDARYPYSADGLTLWAYASGNVKIEESMFNVVLDFTEGKEPNICFFAGRKQEEEYFPVALTGAGKLPFEKGTCRYTVFSPDAAYYITETAAFTACMRMFVGKDKNIRFTLYIQNETDMPLDTYFSAYFNCMLSHADHEYIETKWYRHSRVSERGFELGVTEYLDRTTCFTHRASIVREGVTERVYSTTSRTDYCGGMHNQVCCSTALQRGRFEECKAYTEFTDTAIAGDLIPLTLAGGRSFSVSYTLSIGQTEIKNTRSEEIDALLYAKKEKSAAGEQIPETAFAGSWKGVKAEVFNAFLKNVFRQTEFCARAKNYAGPYIGIRDIFQQLEAALLWIPEYCRGKITEALNYIGENGRAPRQYSYPAGKDAIPAMDLRPYIDQGVWIISTVYRYLAYTNDFSVLEEECGYYRFDGNKVERSARRDTVLEHLLRIAEYLISNLDEDTGCLHALYGDWNDALDGLGKTDDADREYGTGVSVMATLQLYQNLGELFEILTKLKREDEAERYAAVRERVKEGLLKYAVAENEKGERKILHGWGDKRSYCVASFCDNDGESRDGLTSNAFWILSGAIDWDESLKKDILAAYGRLDSKYGIKTFEPYFSMENKKVGRITRLPKGTAENGAVYVHAALFAVWSLFEIGEAERAWEQLYKVLPITHEFISVSPFVMPNSYVYNEEKGFDGESMSDWFTGSGCVLVKILVWQVFGVRADLDKITINPARYIPFDSAKIRLNLRGKDICLNYRKSEGERRFFVNGVSVPSVKNEKTNSRGLVLSENLSNLFIEICGD